MSVLPFTTDAVVIVHAEVVADQYNKLVRDWDDATRTIVRAVVQPLSSVEVTDGRDQTVSTYRFFVDPGTAVTAQDRLEWNDLVLEADGEPAPWRGPIPALDHIQVIGKVVAG